VNSSDETTVVVVLDGDIHLTISARPDLALVDALARLRLSARRHGRSIHLHQPSAALCELLDLVGLALLLDDDREAERREELGVEEVVEPGDPAV
jgi:hypothetical protein